MSTGYYKKNGRITPVVQESPSALLNDPLATQNV
jgi:hypothetical protein